MVFSSVGFDDASIARSLGSSPGSATRRNCLYSCCCWRWCGDDDDDATVVIAPVTVTAAATGVGIDADDDTAIYVVMKGSHLQR